jgi:protein phosphatase
VRRHVTVRVKASGVRAGPAGGRTNATSVGHELVVTHASGVGRRENNEDSILIAPKLGVFAVADGLGGHAQGEIASRLAVEAIRDVFATKPAQQSIPTTLRDALATANDRILATNQREKSPTRRAMATTVVALALDQGRAAGFVAWAGDSRLYRRRNRTLVRMTDDHVVVKPMLQRCLGAIPGEAGELRAFDLRDGDVVMLCSDGLTDTLHDRAIEQVLRRGGDAAALVTAALSVGDARQDNVSVVVVRV